MLSNDLMFPSLGGLVGGLDGFNSWQNILTTILPAVSYKVLRNMNMKERRTILKPLSIHLYTSCSVYLLIFLFYDFNV